MPQGHHLVVVSDSYLTSLQITRTDLTKIEACHGARIDTRIDRRDPSVAQNIAVAGG